MNEVESTAPELLPSETKVTLTTSCGVTLSVEEYNALIADRDGWMQAVQLIAGMCAKHLEEIKILKEQLGRPHPVTPKEDQ